MKKIWIILVTIIICSCESTDEKKEFGMYVAASIDFSILNAQNEDLLNPENPNHLDVSKIKVFYIIDGISQEIYRPNLVRSRGFNIFKNDNNNEYRIVVDLNISNNSDKAITYIQWSETDTDTIEATYKRAYNVLRTKKIWLNGDFVWEEKGINDSPYFKLIK
jgi:hypothetical protein